MRCAIPRCRNEAEYLYGPGLNPSPLCERCWMKYGAEDVPPARLRMALGLPAAAPRLEVEMAKKKTTKSPKTAAALSKAAHKATERTRARAKAAKPAAKNGAAKPAEDAPKPDVELCTFAIRLPRSDAALIHKAAGKGKASQFARQLLIAGATKDRESIETLLATVND